MKVRPLLFAAAVLWSFSSCITDHNQLAKQSDTGSTGSTGFVGRGGAGGTVPLLDTATSVGGTFGGTTATGPIFEYDADGPDELTLIHGQVDAERIAFCFAAVEDGVARRPRGNPLPEGGLDFGGFVTTREPGGLSFEDDSIQPIVLAGDLDSIDGDDCVEALDKATIVDDSVGAAGAAGAAARAEGLWAMALPQLPSGSLTLGRRYLLAVVGCMTRPLEGDENYEELCGAPLWSSAPTLAPVLATVSRQTEVGRMGLQLLHASAGSDELTVEVRSSAFGTESPLRLATDLVFGELSPPTPIQNFSAEDYGAMGGSDVHVLHNGTRELQVSWLDLAEGSGIDELTDDETYVLVLLGPRAGIAEGGGYQGFNVTLIHASEASGD